MKIDIGWGAFTNAFNKAGRKNQFSYEALQGLYDYLIEWEEASGEEYCLDVIELCCEFAQEKIQVLIEEYKCHSFEELEQEIDIIWYDEETILYRQ